MENTLVAFYQPHEKTCNLTRRTGYMYIHKHQHPCLLRDSSGRGRLVVKVTKSMHSHIDSWPMCLEPSAAVKTRRTRGCKKEDPHDIYVAYNPSFRPTS
ncbi:hypothetical protein TNCV_4311251 [Trichonephila clavipes]|nr:hypothetical protein TNCV_4311251 [Trichonephila clavipes]